MKYKHQKNTSWKKPVLLTACVLLVCAGLVVWLFPLLGINLSTRPEADSLPSAAASTPSVAEPRTQEVPILLYHHLSPDPADNTVTPEQFEEAMNLLHQKGYQTVSIEEMIAFVEQGSPLPDKPVCITFDDGYLSNFEYAYPILKKYTMKATIFCIGATVGQTTYYKDTQFPITPHFSFAQAKEMSDSGLISIQSHTYDMHQWEPFETGDKIRTTILKLPNETEAEYTEYLKWDYTRSKSDIEAATGKTVQAVSYPLGTYDELSQSVLLSLGVKATVATSNKAVLVQGDAKSLLNMGRYSVKPDTASADLLMWVE